MKYIKVSIIFFVSIATLAISSDEAKANNLSGSITICVVTISQNDSIIDGSSINAKFKITGIPKTRTNSAGVRILSMHDVEFITPLSLNTKIFNSSSGNDAECKTNAGLAFGAYYYGPQIISGNNSWTAPKYNDQFTHPITKLDDFFIYGDQSAGNENADGHIVISAGRPSRTVVVLNQLSPSSPAGESTRSIIASNAEINYSIPVSIEKGISHIDTNQNRSFLNTAKAGTVGVSSGIDNSDTGKLSNLVNFLNSIGWWLGSFLIIFVGPLIYLALHRLLVRYH